MSEGPNPKLFALVTIQSPSVVTGGLAPVFYVSTTEERDRLALWISRIANAIAHDLGNGTIMLMV